MASVWIQMREDKAPRKLAGHLTIKEARAAMMVGGTDWAKSKPDPKSPRWAKVSPQNGLEIILYFSTGKMAGSLFIEPCSPPSGPEKGSFKVGEVKL